MVQTDISKRNNIAELAKMPYVTCFPFPTTLTMQ